MKDYKDTIFEFGDKVWCYRFVSKFFESPQCGEVICQLPLTLSKLLETFNTNKYFLASCHIDENYWYLVRTDNKEIHFIPETAIRAIEDAIESHDEYISKSPSSPPQLDAWLNQQQAQADRIRFLHKDTNLSYEDETTISKKMVNMYGFKLASTIMEELVKHNTFPIDYWIAIKHEVDKLKPFKVKLNELIEEMTDKFSKAILE